MSTLSTTNLKNPSASGNNIVLATDGSATIATLSSTTITGTTIQGTIKSGTAVASTSGTSIDFTSIPSWVKRVTVMLNGVSLSGSSIILIQLGTSSGVETTGYAGSGSNPGAGIAQQYQSAQYTTGFGIGQGAGAAVAVSGLVFITAFGSSNKYIASGTLTSTTEAVTRLTAGDKTLSGTLDRVRITSVNGTDTFDAGSINIMYEG
jgi:hypothetical protein